MKYNMNLLNDLYANLKEVEKKAKMDAQIKLKNDSSYKVAKYVKVSLIREKIEKIELIDDKISEKYMELKELNRKRRHIKSDLDNATLLNEKNKYNKELKETEETYVELEKDYYELQKEKNSIEVELKELVSKLEEAYVQAMLLEYLEQLKGSSMYDSLMNKIEKEDSKLFELLNKKLEFSVKEDDSRTDEEEAKRKAEEEAKKLEKATKLVEEAEKTKKEEDIKKAYDAVNELNDSIEKEELLKRLKALGKTKEEEFKELYSKIADNSINGFDDLEFKELVRLYKELDSDVASKYKEAMERLIMAYNLSRQDSIQEEYETDKKNKYKLSNILLEIPGTIVNAWVNSKLFKKINKAKLQKAKKAYENASEDKKEKKARKVEKINTKLQNSETVNGFRLFVSKNKISKLKAKLYKGEITDKDNKKFERAQAIFDKKSNKVLSKVTLDETLSDDSKRICNILDQYLELLSVMNQESKTDETNDFAARYNEALSLLNTYKNSVSEAEYNAYLYQLNLIKTYRDRNDMIFEYNNDEINDVIKYYDSEEYEKDLNKLSYINYKKA